ncbi:MAG: hypothetical protein AAGK47_07480 [Bacteroidota bacterium]
MSDIFFELKTYSFNTSNQWESRYSLAVNKKEHYEMTTSRGRQTIVQLIIEEYRDKFDKVNYNSKDGTTITPTKSFFDRGKDYFKGGVQ